jgi:hypothetical protein
MAIFLDGKKKENNYLKTIGVFLITIAVAICLPLMVQNSVRYIKEKGIEDYLNGKVQVIQLEEQNYYLWQNIENTQN